MAAAAATADTTTRWTSLEPLLNRGSKLAPAGFLPDSKEAPTIKNFLAEDIRVLVIGAGGLGCELLKNLALSGIRQIDVIDMDTIDATNLNRQFLFRAGDVGNSKANAAAAFINRRVQGVKVTPHHKAIQDMDDEFYMQFQVIILGLDSIDARRWINAKAAELVTFDADGKLQEETVIPLIDGGTEAFKGHSRLVVPFKTACFECTLDFFPPAVNFPLCTLASTPRSPEHCIEWAKLIHWEEQKPFGSHFDAKDKRDKANPVDTDNPEHMQWLFTHAEKRAAEFNIKGVTYKLTQGVVKRIIPAIASTNALVSANCVNEALKLASSCAPSMSNYMQYNSADGCYTYTFEPERNPTCPVCGTTPKVIRVDPDLTLDEWVEALRSTPDLQLKEPSIAIYGEKKRQILMRGPLFAKTQANLKKKIAELINDKEEIAITDKALGNKAARVVIHYAHPPTPAAAGSSTTTATTSTA